MPKSDLDLPSVWCTKSGYFQKRCEVCGFEAPNGHISQNADRPGFSVRCEQHCEICEKAREERRAMEEARFEEKQP